MARKKVFGIRGATAQPYGGGAHQAADNLGRKSSGLKVRKNHGGSRKQRKIAGGRM